MTSVIYKPRGAAAEYAEWACNPFLGCTHGCKYCYGPQTLHMSKERYRNPIPKRNVLDRLAKDARARKGESLMVTLSFVCDAYMKPDPCNHLMNRGQLEHITREAIRILQTYGHRVTILTKGGNRSLADFDLLRPGLDRYAATLTFTDEEDSIEWEPNAAPQAERIAALVEAKTLGLDTYASIEPVVYPRQSLELIRSTWLAVDEFKVGKLTKHPHARTIDWPAFVGDAVALLDSLPVTYMLKDSLKEYKED